MAKTKSITSEWEEYVIRQMATVVPGFLGSRWKFIVFNKFKAFWVHDTGLILNSSRNGDGKKQCNR